MTTYNWDFPNNNYTNNNGLSTSDMETFSKDPISSLAREICQNSIDAQLVNEKARVEFKLFTINRNNIPGIDTLTEEIEKAYNYKKDDPKEGKALKLLKDSINKEEIVCLRISDFNTTGLTGVSTKNIDSRFYKLTRGSGTSDKDGTSGGSKGIGKFASFVASTTNTVFYSTKTSSGEEGYMGICKLRSVPLPGDDDLMTAGTGYYSTDKKHYAICEPLQLDPDFCRADDEYGTDVYLIGFNDNETWKNDIAAKVLDSFMAAILLNDFEVIVEDMRINSKTVKKIIDDLDLFKTRGVKEARSIKSQYDLLTEEGIDKRTIPVGDKSTITVYVKKYDRINEGEASRQCIMVRYPYMKIKHTTGASNLPYSALCIIDDNELNIKLRDIENPQHTDWEIKRLDSFPEEKEYTRQLKQDMERAIRDYIGEVMRQGEGESTDVVGAGDYLPSMDNGDPGEGNNETENKDVTISAPKDNGLNLPKTEHSGDDGEQYDFSTGDSDGEGETGRKPNPGEDEPQPNPGGKGEPKDEDEVGGDGEDNVLKKVPLSGIRFRNIIVDPKESRYDIVFIAPSDEDNCDLVLRQVGESGDKYQLNIIEASIDGIPCLVKKGKIHNIKLEKNKKHTIQYRVSESDVFACEVVMNAHR